MKINMKAVWCFDAVVFSALVVCGAFFYVSGAANLVTFVTIIYLAATLILLDHDNLAAAKDRGLPAMPWSVQYLFSVPILAIMIWHGWLWTAVFYFLHLFFMFFQYYDEPNEADFLGKVDEFIKTKKNGVEENKDKKKSDGEKFIFYLSELISLSKAHGFELADLISEGSFSSETWRDYFDRGYTATNAFYAEFPHLNVQDKVDNGN